MCSPKQNSQPLPSTISTADRTARVNQLKIQQKNPFTNYEATKQLAAVLAIPTDTSADRLTMPLVGQAPAQSDVTSPGATGFELAPDKLTSQLTKRATSNLRIPVTTPKTYPN